MLSENIWLNKYICTFNVIYEFKQMKNTTINFTDKQTEANILHLNISSMTFWRIITLSMNLEMLVLIYEQRLNL